MAHTRGSIPTRHRVRSTASSRVPTNLPSQPAHGSESWKRLLFHPLPHSDPGPALSTGVCCGAVQESLEEWPLKDRGNANDQNILAHELKGGQPKKTSLWSYTVPFLPMTWDRWVGSSLFYLRGIITYVE